MSVRSMNPSWAPGSVRVHQRASRISRCQRPIGKQPDGAICELRELVYRYRTRAGADSVAVRVAAPLRSVDAAAAVLRPLLEDEAVEVFGVLCLNPSGRVICWHEVARGGLDSASFRLREVFKPAILANASSIVAAHNHPSGEPDPSAIDLDLTQELIEAGALLRIAVLDHIVIGYRKFVSVRLTWPALFQSAGAPP